ncbi:hypothetical protein HRbin26_02440 [bacterium HR26]|nr:hypothetical protein HRbin26_02440 [bacterium HR26]
MVPDHVGHVAQANRLAAAVQNRAPELVGDDHLRELLRRDDGRDMADRDPLIGRVDEPAAGDRCSGRCEEEHAGVQRVAGGAHDLLYCDAVLLQARGIDLHDLHLKPLTPDGHVGHAGHCHQARPDRPVRDHRHVHQGELLRGEPDLHDPARRGQRVDDDRRACPAREGRRDDGEALLHQLSREQEVSSPLEAQVDRRELRNRLREHHVEPGQAGERLLDRDSHQLLHLSGGQRDGRRLDLHPGRGELGEDVHRHGADLRAAEVHHRGSDSDHEKSVGQAGADDPAYQACHCRGPLFTLNAQPRTRCRTARPCRLSLPGCRRVDHPPGWPGLPRCARR